MAVIWGIRSSRSHGQSSSLGPADAVVGRANNGKRLETLVGWVFVAVRIAMLVSLFSVIAPF